MRNTIIAYLKGLGLKNLQVSTELPFDANGTPLYEKNSKRLYSDNEQVDREVFMALMSGRHLYQESVTVVVYLSTDAKQKPNEYSTVLEALQDTKSIDTENKFPTSRTTKVTTEYNQDLLVTTVELTFSRITL